MGNREKKDEIMLPDGNKYSGEWLDGFMDGQGCLRMEDGSVYEGTFVKGSWHGTGLL